MWEYDGRNQRLSKKKEKKKENKRTTQRMVNQGGRGIRVLDAGDNHGLLK